MLPQVPSKGLDADGHYIWYYMIYNIFNKNKSNPHVCKPLDSSERTSRMFWCSPAAAWWRSIYSFTSTLAQQDRAKPPETVRKRRGTGDLYEAITCDTRFWISEWVIQREGHGQIPRPALGGRCKESPIVSSIWTWNHTAKRDKDAHP